MARNWLQVRAMIMAARWRRVNGGSAEWWVARWDGTPNRWPSGAVQAVPVLFEAGAETGDDALHDPASVGDCR